MGELPQIIQKELGVQVPFGTYGYRYEEFFLKCQIRDLLYSITIIGKILKKKISYELPGWKSFVSRALHEENLSYQLDNECGIRFYVDEEFNRNILSVISSLEGARYVAVADALKHAFEKISSIPPETKNSIRSIYEAVETLFKIMFNIQGKERLSSVTIKQHLQPFIEQIYSNDAIAQTSSKHILDCFCDWLTSAHQYRHGQNVEDAILEPPLELTILIISSGTSFLRWLAQLDKEKAG
jgi:hypothetical protein